MTNVRKRDGLTALCRRKSALDLASLPKQYDSVGVQNRVGYRMTRQYERVRKENGGLTHSRPRVGR